MKKISRSFMTSARVARVPSTFREWVIPGRLLCVVLLCAGLLAVSATRAADWPHVRGPGFDGRGVHDGELGRGHVALELAWRVPLGSGYSGVAIAGDRAVVLFTDGTDDLAAAYDVDSGREIWRHRIDHMNAGRDGSHDGPVSSPMIADGRVFVLGARGQLIALRLETGAVVWQKSLPTEYGAALPDHGFGTTPIVTDGVLVVLVGGTEGRSLAAFDPATGAERWALGEGQVEYQSPVAMHLAGRNQVVTIAGTQLLGVDPGSGSLLWSHLLGEEDWASSAMPSPMGDDRFFLTISGVGVIFRLVERADGLRVEEQLRTSDLGGSYALPVLHEGVLYGFRGQILTAVDATTGKRLWRSRPPGGRGLIMVDDQLVIFGSGGHVVVAPASPGAYVETARFQALGASAYTWPSFADGKVFVRNLEELAAVYLVPVPEPVPEPAPSGLRVESGEAAMADTAGTADTAESGAERFAGFVARLERAQDPEVLISEFLAAHPVLPLVEGDDVHFVYVGDGEDLAIAGSMLDVGEAQAMKRVGSTRFFYRTYRLEGARRWEYRFVRDFGEDVLDPHNPGLVPSERGELSELRLSDYEPPVHLDEPRDRPRGRLEELVFSSSSLGIERDMSVYLPSGYDDQLGREYPLLVMHEGADWIDKGRFLQTLDNLIGERVEPLVVAFLEPRDAWWLEAGGTDTLPYVDSLARELVPFLEQRFRLRRAAAARAVYGRRHFGMTAYLAAFRHPQVFGKAAAQSAGLWLGSEVELFELVAKSSDLPAVLYLDWNRFDARSRDAGFDFKADSLGLAQALEAAGFEFAGGEFADSYGWGGWRARSGRFLEALFPLGDGGSVKSGGGRAGNSGGRP